jgi:homoserine dehydrogenase
MKHINIGLFGFGCVGQGLYETINNSNNFSGEIKKICIKNPDKHRSLAKELFTTDASSVINDPAIDIVVELIDDADAAKEIVVQALKAGKSVVTANKKMVAEHLEELVVLQEATGKAVLYEGAVCGSIPVIRTLEEYFGHEPLKELKGIVNGSTNYILTQVFDKGIGYSEALSKAQALGFAESDPSLDVKGYDAKYKLSILLTHAFGEFVKPSQLINFGIDRITKADLAFAKRHQLEIKLLANAKKFGDQIFAFVIPQFVSKHHSLANIRDEFNAVSLIGEFCDEQRFVGKGAGSLPTGAAVLSDISALSYDYRYEYKKRSLDTQLYFSHEKTIEVYASFKDPNNIDLSLFDQIKERYFSFDHSYIIGEINLERLLDSDWRNIQDINLVLTPESESVRDALLNIDLLNAEVLELKKGREILEKISL